MFNYKQYLYIVPLAFLFTWSLWGCESSSVDAINGTESSSLNPVETAKPDWAGGGGNHDNPGNGNKGGNGNPNSGTKKGDTYGDMYVILRDDNGVPILIDGYVRPVDANGDILPLDEEGNLIDEDAAIEVEIGRLNVSRSPSKVLDRRLTEVYVLLEQADAITIGPAGRLVITTTGVEKTIDAPLENLALYRELMNNGILNVNLKPDVEIDENLKNNLFEDATRSPYDMLIAASLLAGGADKTVAMTVDEIIYINTIIGIEGSITANGIKYVDFEGFSYNRANTYGSRTADVLKETYPGSGIFEKQTVNIYDEVFDNNYDESDTIAAFTKAADDARRVINYLHEYEVPAVTP